MATTQPRKRKAGITHKHCGARMPKGRFCKLPAGHDTDHPGIGTCSRHGGKSPIGLKSTGVELAHKGIIDPKVSAADMIEIEPHNGLLIAVRSSAGEFFYWMQKIRENPESMQIVREMRESRMQMARLSKMALDAGLAERQVQLQERMADLMARFAVNLLQGLDLTPEQQGRVPQLLEQTLLGLEDASEYPTTKRPKQALIHHKKSDVYESESAA
jgi:hypothetical protein